MSLTKQQYINFLINEGKRNLISNSPNFFKSLQVFLESDRGKQGFIKFQKLDPTLVGCEKQPEHISHSVKRIFS